MTDITELECGGACSHSAMLACRLGCVAWRSRQTIGRVMSDPKDRDPRDKPPQAPGPGDAKRSGRAGVDERGNTVWEWQLETGVYSRDISTQKLKKLDLGDLSIAETASHQRPGGLGDEKRLRRRKRRAAASIPTTAPAAAGAGGNPYDNARNSGKTSAAARQPVAPPARKPMDLKRLEEWMQIKKRLEAAEEERGRRGLAISAPCNVLPDPLGQGIRVRRDRCLLVQLEKAPLGYWTVVATASGSSDSATNRLPAFAICSTSAASAVENSSLTENSTGRLCTPSTDLR